MRFEVTDAMFQLDSGFYPFVLVFLNGDPARLYFDQKFLDLDIVDLGAGWEDRVEPIEIPWDEKKGWGGVTLRGYVEDWRLAELVRRLRAVMDREDMPLGPVDIPEPPEEEESE